jgi:hypothetical protein
LLADKETGLYWDSLPELEDMVLEEVKFVGEIKYE